ncbi:SDR family NAD(P)-dependent oxidoreductase [Algoriphagus lacus]|uniref:SDR family NAD(P)-dependent oxidoreductase n=1 Tax=Algoriphagus lacus TaxID=2056311 RepID=A0A418PNL3_9BACT|nr:oxidoreductase [Algoriphagus lacus]RIW13417.1 SDR family NAD(P)-dependent oxidoreductase [Algoriphagus lacus]
MTTKKVALITGASTGIGKATAILLAQHNYTVYAAARRLDKLLELEQWGIKVIPMDVTDEKSLVNGVERIFKAENHIDILINNAGYGGYGSVEDVSMKDAKRQLEVNLFSAARLIQLVLPKMRANRFGKIVNISSIGGKFATPFGGWYHASKFALEGLSDSLRNEVKQFGIDVIVVEPGGVKSEWADITVENLIKSSEKSAYKASVDRFAQFLKKSTENNSEPIVIAKLIMEGIESKSPKFRYVGGYNAKLAVMARKLLSDQAFDKMILSQMK